MKLKFLFLFVGLIGPSVFGASVADHPTHVTVHPYLQEVTRVSTAIRVAEDEAVRAPLFRELRSLLEHPADGCTADPIFAQAAYALCVNGDVEGPVDEHLVDIKTQARPVQINDGMYYSALPLGGGSVFLEKLTPGNIEDWRSYIYANGFGRQFSLWDIEEEGSKIPQWRKYLLSDQGWVFFRDRINVRWNESNPYDIWVAYLSSTDPSELAAKRSAGSPIDPTDLKMVMTVQMKMGLDTYSPMGISRTTHGAQMLYAAEQAGTPRQKIDPSESIWFHALTGRILQSINPSLKSLWTTPLESMSLIFAQALYPKWKLFPRSYHPGLIKYVAPRREDSQASLSDFLTYDVAAKIKVLPRDGYPECPWKSDPEFIPWGGMAVQIGLGNLLSALFPYQKL